MSRKRTRRTGMEAAMMVALGSAWPHMKSRESRSVGCGQFRWFLLETLPIVSLTWDVFSARDGCDLDDLHDADNTGAGKFG
jgi:hypothetical protein